MSQTSLLPVPKSQFLDSNGKPLAGGLVYTYQPGTTTQVATYIDSGGLTPNAWPVVLDSAGMANIWISGYVKVAVYNAASVLQYTVDNVSSMPNTTLTTSQWIAQSLVLTYVSATQFTVPTDLTATFQVNRRITATVSAGTIYGTITVSSSGGSPVITTVTVVWDSGALDSGLSSVSVGIITPLNTSLYFSVANGIPKLDANSHVIQNPASANATPTANGIPIYSANKDLLDRNSNPLFASGVPNSNATGNTVSTTIANIAVTNGDIIAVQAQGYWRSNATESESYQQTLTGVTYQPLPGTAVIPGFTLDATANHNYAASLFSIYYIAQTGNLSISGSITATAPLNITNSIGYAFLKKQ